MESALSSFGELQTQDIPGRIMAYVFLSSFVLPADAD